MNNRTASAVTVSGSDDGPDALTKKGRGKTPPPSSRKGTDAVLCAQCYE